MIQSLTSFETYDALATPNRKPEAVAALITRLAYHALGWEEATPLPGPSGRGSPRLGGKGARRARPSPPRADGA